MFNLAHDHLSRSEIGYPNLAQHVAAPFTPEWRRFDSVWPFVVPLRLIMYLQQANVSYSVHHASTAPAGSWYPICFGWFDFSIDYLALVPAQTLSRIRARELKILFYYHEGDNPGRIIDRLEQLCQQHKLDDAFVFVSANSAAAKLPNSIYFQEHECFFRYVNRNQCVEPVDLIVRDKDFTVLSRTPKWWRATVLCDLQTSGLLDNSLWSYDTLRNLNEDINDNPIEIDSLSGVRDSLPSFFSQGPYRCDHVESHDQNDHHWVNQELYSKSHFHVVLETHFDADQSGGTFLTEKTFKAIKFGQPFILVAPHGSLAQLQQQGYKIFDHVIDPSYDSIIDNTQRWKEIKKVIAHVQRQDPHSLFVSCLADIKHNQDLFHQRLQTQVNNLLDQLACYQ